MFQKDHSGCKLEDKARNKPRFKDIEWKVVQESISVPIIDCNVLELMGCDNREILTAGREKYGEDIEVASGLAADSNEEIWITCKQ